jgi:hypothetical protein
MSSPRKFNKLVPVLIILLFMLVCSIIAGFFFSRPPVLFVTDSTFFMLYGPERFRQKQREISLSLFRPVIPVNVSENTGHDIIAIATEEAFSSPWAVLFPYRYHASARLYKDKHRDVPVVVMGGMNPVPEGLSNMDITYFRTDVLVDLYRAVLSAFVLAGEKEVLILCDESFSKEYQAPLGEMLVSSGYTEEPVFLAPFTHFNRFSDIGCVIVTGSASRHLDQIENIPVILFSWVDPALTPQAVKVVVDDSPWAMANRALKAMDSGEILMPSAAVILGNRIDKKTDFRKIRDFFREVF